MAKAIAEQNPVRSIQAEGKKVAKEAAFSPLMERLARLGYAVKGFLYVAIGFISIAGALGKAVRRQTSWERLLISAKQSCLLTMPK